MPQLKPTPPPAPRYCNKHLYFRIVLERLLRLLALFVHFPLLKITSGSYRGVDDRTRDHQFHSTILLSPAAVAFEATGCLSPNPSTATEEIGMLCYAR